MWTINRVDPNNDISATPPLKQQCEPLDYSLELLFLEDSQAVFSVVIHQAQVAGIWVLITGAYFLLLSGVLES